MNAARSPYIISAVPQVTGDGCSGLGRPPAGQVVTVMNKAVNHPSSLVKHAPERGGDWTSAELEITGYAERHVDAGRAAGFRGT